ncbi:MAG: hypothetical protein LBR54_01985 [Oscillospiraceae bacterium]|nr:hypothetical protein [Oscillospiraceae bacterium]
MFFHYFNEKNLLHHNGHRKQLLEKCVLNTCDKPEDEISHTGKFRNMASLRKYLRDNAENLSEDVIDGEIHCMSENNKGELHKLCQELIIARRTSELLFDKAMRVLAGVHQTYFCRVLDSLYDADNRMFNIYFNDLLYKDSCKKQLLEKYPSLTGGEQYEKEPS